MGEDIAKLKKSIANISKVIKKKATTILTKKEPPTKKLP